MTTLGYSNAPASRLAAGDAVLAAAKTVVIAPIAKRLAGFDKAHRAYATAQEKVAAAATRLSEQQRRVAERDVDQDQSILALAGALAGLGLPRANPFRALGFEAPSDFVQLGYAVEAERVHALVGAIGKRKPLAKGAAAACKRAVAAARAVEAALAKVPPLERRYKEALVAREATAQPWETAFAALKRAARSADDDGGELFATLFERTAPAKPRKKRTARAAAKTGTEG